MNRNYYGVFDVKQTRLHQRFSNRESDLPVKKDNFLQSVFQIENRPKTIRSPTVYRGPVPHSKD